MDMKAKDDYEVTLLNRFIMSDKEVCFNISFTFLHHIKESWLIKSSAKSEKGRHSVLS